MALTSISRGDNIYLPIYIYVYVTYVTPLIMSIGLLIQWNWENKGLNQKSSWFHQHILYECHWVNFAMRHGDSTPFTATAGLFQTPLAPCRGPRVSIPGPWIGVCPIWWMLQMVFVDEKMFLYSLLGLWHALLLGNTHILGDFGVES